MRSSSITWWTQICSVNRAAFLAEFDDIGRSPEFPSSGLEDSGVVRKYNQLDAPVNCREGPQAKQGALVI
jgi:hypothetical protein